MDERLASEAFDLIHDIALNAETRCEEPIPGIIRDALNEIVALARYKGSHGNLIASDRRQQFGLSEPEAKEQ